MRHVELIQQTSDSPARFPYPQRDSSTTELQKYVFILERNQQWLRNLLGEKLVYVFAKRREFSLSEDNGNREPPGTPNISMNLK